MIVKLTGILEDTATGQLTIDVNGVGYNVSVSLRTLSQLPNKGEKISLWIEHIIRQDQQQLCGFNTKEERHCFQLLMSVQGVGLKVALAILSNLSPLNLQAVISQKNVSALTSADGVGAKIAGRIVLELKDKILTLGPMSESDQGSQFQSSLDSSPVQEAVLALISLGYSRSAASQALAALAIPADSPVADFIKLALQKLSKL